MKNNLKSKDMIDLVLDLTESVGKKHYVNIDMKDIKQSLSGMNEFFYCRAEGTDTLQIMKDAIENPLFMECPIESARSLVLFFKGKALPMKEFAKAAEYLSNFLNEDADMIWGAENDDGKETVSVIMFGGK
jgi:cell division GTPase FtsZ